MRSPVAEKTLTCRLGLIKTVTWLPTSSCPIRTSAKSLTSRGAEVHAILTVRDAIQTLPAQWQTHSRNAGRVSWPEFAKSVRSMDEQKPRRQDARGARVFQRSQAIPRMVRAWGSAVEPGHLHVITVPPPGSEPMLLWERFAETVGLDPALCTVRSRRSNTSLGQASAELMRRINRRLGHVSILDYRATLKGPLADQVLAKRSRLETRARLDVETLKFATDWNRRAREAILASGVHPVGDLDDLPAEVPAELTGLIRLAIDLQRQIESADDGKQSA